MLVRILFDCADDHFLVETFAVGTGLGPAELPDIRAYFATVAFHRSALHFVLLHRYCGAEESSDIAGRVGGKASELFCGGNAQLPCGFAPAVAPEEWHPPACPGLSALSSMPLANTCSSHSDCCDISSRGSSTDARPTLQNRSDRVPEGMPSHPVNPKFLE